MRGERWKFTVTIGRKSRQIFRELPGALDWTIQLELLQEK